MRSEQRRRSPSARVGNPAARVLRAIKRERRQMTEASGVLRCLLVGALRAPDQTIERLEEGQLRGAAARRTRSGEPLPSNCIIHQANILRSMLISISALNSADARAKRRAMLPDNVGQSWAPTVEEQLRSEFLAKEPIEVSAARHRRTLRAVEARLQRLDLISEADRKTRGGFASPE